MGFLCFSPQADTVVACSCVPLLCSKYSEQGYNPGDSVGHIPFVKSMEGFLGCSPLFTATLSTVFTLILLLVRSFYYLLTMQNIVVAWHKFGIQWNIEE